MSEFDIKEFIEEGLNDDRTELKIRFMWINRFSQSEQQELYKEIAKLNSLNTLDLSGNQISDASFLKELKSLTTLNLSNNKISDASFLKELKSLTTLNLNNNRISDASFLKELKSLTLLY
nr:leucine-rich repeat domain-containing protein [Pyrinomonadaceae bacterium]